MESFTNRTSLLCTASATLEAVRVSGSPDSVSLRVLQVVKKESAQCVHVWARHLLAQSQHLPGKSGVDFFLFFPTIFVS